MPWDNSPEARRRSAETYSDPEYVKNRATCKQQANGRCAECGHKHPRLQCDHIVPVTQGGTHALSNLRMVCVGTGSCKCHERKTANEGNAGKRAEKLEVERRTVW